MQQAFLGLLAVAHLPVQLGLVHNFSFDPRQAELKLRHELQFIVPRQHDLWLWMSRTLLVEW